MPVPSLITDLSTTAGSNSPSGSDNVFPDLDNYLRALSAFMASIRDNSGNGWTSPYLPLTYSAGTANGVVYLNGSKVVTTGSGLVFDGTNFSTTGTATATKLIPTGSSATGNGMYLPAANTLAWSNNGAETMRLDTSGNLGLGVTPSAKLHIAGSAFRHNDATGSYGYTITATSSKTVTAALFGGGYFAWQTNNSGSDAMTLDASGNLGVGTTSPGSYGRLALSSTGTPTTAYASVLSAAGVYNGGFESSLYLGAARTDIVDNGVVAGWRVKTQSPNASTGSYLAFESANSATAAFAPPTTFTERARITSGGNLLVGTTSDASNVRCNFTFAGNSTNGIKLENTSASGSPYAFAISYSGYSPNNSNQILTYSDSTALRWEFRANGGLANYSANDVNLSDRREKTNFAPAKSYLDTICSIPVQTFNYVDQSPDDPGLTLGVVAQDVQAVAPELVMESNWGTEDNPKIRLSIYQTDLQYALMKCIQELKAQNDELRARVAALEQA